MKKMRSACTLVLMLAGWAQAYNYTVIGVGTNPTFVYQKDVSSNKEGNSILNDAWMNELQYFETEAKDRAWIGQVGMANEIPMVFHFQAPEGCTIQSAQVFTRTYLRMDHWENLALKANWGTTAYDYSWQFMNDTNFYSRSHLSTDAAPPQSEWTVENTSSIPNVNSRDLFLTFTTNQGGYAAMDWSKEWFVSDGSETYSPGLVVTLTINAPPVKGDANGDRIVDSADVEALAALITAGTTDLQYDLNGDGVVGQADMDYLTHKLLNQPLNGPIAVGTGPTFVYQRDLSPDKDDNSMLNEAAFDHATVYGNTDTSWASFSGTNGENGCYFTFEAPAGYTIKHARIFTRSFMFNGPDVITLNAYWSSSFPQHFWDYWGTNKFITRTSGNSGTVDTFTDTIDLDVNSAQLALGFTAAQSDWSNQVGAKGWFVTDNSVTYDPGLVVTLTIQAPLIKGDINGDRVVNAADLDALKALVAGGTTDLQYDLNGDGAVGQADVDYLAHNLLNLPLNGPIPVGTAPTFIYQRDVSSNKDGKSLLNETEFNVLQWFETTDKAWVGQMGNAQDMWQTFHFQAPEDYVIQSAEVFTRSYLRDDHWENVSLKATWGTEARQFSWDYLYQNTPFYSRVNTHTGTGIWTDENTATLPVGGKSDLYLTFSTFQDGYAAMDWSKEWFVSPAGDSYDPGLKVILSVVPVEKVSVVLDNFESDPFIWTRAEPNAQFSVAKQSAVKYEGNYAMDLHVDHTANNSYWSRVQGILPAGQDWTNYKKIKVMVKSSVPGATAFIGWDFLINGVTDANRVNGPSGCGSFVLPADTEWHSITLDLTNWTRDNVTGLQFYVANDLGITGSYDLYFDNIRLEGDPGPGDANKDGKVDVSDLGILAANYGATSGAAWTTGDFNKDGKVDVSDLGILAANYGSGTGSSLDFNADAKALGLAVGGDEAKAETPVTSALGCGSAGLPLIAGLLLAGLLLSGLKLKE